MTDMVNHPPHYKQGDIETIDIILDIAQNLEGDEGYLVGNIVKYISRYKFKNGVEDLKKAQWYIDRLLVEVKEKEKENLYVTAELASKNITENLRKMGITNAEVSK